MLLRKKLHPKIPLNSEGGEGVCLLHCKFNDSELCSYRMRGRSMSLLTAHFAPLIKESSSPSGGLLTELRVIKCPRDYHKKRSSQGSKKTIFPIDIFMLKHKYINMRTSLDLQDELLIEIKVLAAQERLTLKELLHDLLRSGLKARQKPLKPSVAPIPYRSTLEISNSLILKLRKESVQ